MGRHVTWIAWQAATTIALLLVVAVPRTGAGQTITVEAPNALSVAVVLAGTRPTVCPVPGLGSMLEALFAADVTYRNVSSAPLAVARGKSLSSEFPTSIPQNRSLSAATPGPVITWSCGPSRTPASCVLMRSRFFHRVVAIPAHR